MESESLSRHLGSCSKAVFKGIAGVVLALVVCQIVAARVFSFTQASDPVLGSVFTPGSTVHYQLEGRGVSTWAEHGVRGAATRWETTSPRVLVLGDSFTEALQVDDDQVYTAVAARALQEAGLNVAVLNFGRSSASVADYIQWVGSCKSVFAPSWVVIQVQQQDFTEDAWKTNKSVKSAAYFTRDTGSSELRLVAPAAEPKKEKDIVRRTMDRARNAVALFQFALRRVEELTLWVKREPPLFRAPVPKPPRATTNEEGWRAFPVAEELDWLKKAYDGRVSLLYLSEFDPAHPGTPTPFESYLADLCAKRGIGFAATSTKYASLAGTGEAPFGFPNSNFNRGHMNVVGHRLAAAALSDELKRVCAEHGLH